MAKRLVRETEGKPITDDDILLTVDALKQCRQFQNIDVREIPEKDGSMSVLITLTPFRRIKDIEIEGASPLFEKEVLTFREAGFRDMESPQVKLSRARLFEK